MQSPPIVGFLHFYAFNRLDLKLRFNKFVRNKFERAKRAQRVRRRTRRIILPGNTPCTIPTSPIPPSLSTLHDIFGDEQVYEPGGDIGVEDHHAHGGGGGDITGIVHIEYGDRGQCGVR